jgi:hypothetical protein
MLKHCNIRMYRHGDDVPYILRPQYYEVVSSQLQTLAGFTTVERNVHYHREADGTQSFQTYW